MTERRERGWLPEGGNAPRRGVLEDTLFRRLEEMRKKPPGELFELLERTLDVLRATKEALLEQRREIRSLATAVDTLRARVDQLVQVRPAEVRPAEAAPEPAWEPEPEPELEAEPVAEVELEPEPEVEPEEPELPPAASTEPFIAQPFIAQPSIAQPSIAQPAFTQVTEHIVMVPTTAGYRIITGGGAEAEPTLEVDGIVFDIAGRMASPFPGDTRTAYFATRSEAASPV